MSNEKKLENSSGVCWQVRVFHTYDTMTTNARRHPEGSLVYVLDQTDLFLRVRDGVRQVHVTNSTFYPKSTVVFFLYVHAAAVFPAGQLHRSSWRREWLFPHFFKTTSALRVHACQTRLQENNIAAVEPPPVVLYSPDSNTGAAQPESPVHRPHDPYSQHPTYPDPHYHPDPRYPAPSDPRYPSYTERANRPEGRYSSHTTQDRPTYPYQRYPLTTPRRPPAPETPVHRHTSGPGVCR